MSESNNLFVFDVTAESFARDVVERSATVPVVIDFWAAWCGPCRRLGPLLEKLAGEYEGQFALAKADTGAVPEIARSFGVMSIPAVFGVRDGKVVDSFVGLIPETQIRQFLDRLLPTPAERLVNEAKALEASDPAGAEAKLRQAVALEPSPIEAGPRIALAELLLRIGGAEEAATLIADLERRGYLEPEAEKLKAQLTVRAGAADAGPLDAACAAVEMNPDDLTARLHLAEALAAAGRHKEALETALELVERDRRGTGEDARKLMLAVFSLLPPDSPLLSEYRRRLSFVL